VKLAMTLLVKDEVDIIRHHLDAHLDAGVEHVVVTDNASRDGTRDILAEYDRLREVTVIDEPGDDFSQHRWVTRMAMLAKTRLKAEWVINSDADEFWVHSTGDLRDALEGASAHLLRAPRFNLVYPFDRENADPWFMRVVYRAARPRPLPKRRPAPTKALPTAYFLLDLPPKAIVRTDRLERIHQGNHSADFAGSVVTGAADIQVFHFPIRSAAQFEAKIRNGGAAYERNTELSNGTGWHWRRWHKMLMNGGVQRALADALPSADAIATGLEKGTILEDRTMASVLGAVCGSQQ
jgi:hypothetical protein